MGRGLLGGKFYFKNFPDGSLDKSKVICAFCRVEFKYHRSSTSLAYHLRAKHPAEVTSTGTSQSTLPVFGVRGRTTKRVEIEENCDDHLELIESESVKVEMESVKVEMESVTVETESVKAGLDASAGILSEAAEIEAPIGQLDSQQTETRAEISMDFLKSVKKTLEMDKKDDELEIFGKNIVFKLRKIQDPWTLVVVQNEIEQACFRGMMASQPNQTVTNTENNHNNHEEC
ncbi:uncharacterized protein LOC133410995 isoform X2 [Phycodurus eques]|uniref:uncharacterized protein LOC133410995 isoform X2 n=1 Tax=Phycodurus eques TaxID=693459 RepID=UPI002ACD6768|nr:uncharacterized protein LOC133410995 isoform X2 [Phycodurus eques]